MQWYEMYIKGGFFLYTRLFIDTEEFIHFEQFYFKCHLNIAFASIPVLFSINDNW